MIPLHVCLRLYVSTRVQNYGSCLWPHLQTVAGAEEAEVRSVEKSIVPQPTVRLSKTPNRSHDDRRTVQPDESFNMPAQHHVMEIYRLNTPGLHCISQLPGAKKINVSGIRSRCVNLTVGSRVGVVSIRLRAPPPPRALRLNDSSKAGTGTPQYL